MTPHKLCKKYCLICNRKRPWKEGRAASCQAKRNAILLGCMVKLNTISLKTARQIFDDVCHSTKVYHDRTRTYKRFCKEHYAESVALLTAMVEARTDKGVSYGFDVVVSLGVILDMLEELDLAKISYDGDIKVEPSDLSAFYSTYASDLHETAKQRVKAQVVATSAQPMVQGVKLEISEVLPETSCCSPSAEPSADIGTGNGLFHVSAPKTEPQDPEEEVPFPETDPTLLDRYFHVRGEKLLNLFQFCPQCGHKLYRTALTATGTAPVVHFLCDECNSTAMRWEGQDLPPG